ncbi:uncharacterized protein LOC130747802 isoform X3 [Lotus japonicus]|uniref:uncharacterized protein LOC130747802 isoform X3 n=1 Tax=Lotus japonicus TaxID=34305 RepID=UPI0025839137|nr:uncharacterized protein LOC130747802 isoform X3 [Lotus japonicus]
MRLEPGTCKVCSAPCSTCIHLNRVAMGSKAEEYSDENCRVGEANQYSTSEGDGSLSSRACNRLKDAVTKTSNTPSDHSSHDFLSENAESKPTLSEKYQDSKCLEGLDDSISCNNRASKANLVSGSHQINSDGINISCSSASVSLLGKEGSRIGTSVDMSGLSDILSSKDAAIPENLSECCIENADTSLTKERESIIVSGEKSLTVTAKVPLKIYPNSEADTDNDYCNAKDINHRYSAHDILHENAEEPVKSPGVPVPQSEDESDESDIVEHDVKVCDICGDSGREDLLAICCRCSDGAEHTYCMREMLEKVPEGDWLCEECKHAEGSANLRLDAEVNKNRKVSSSSQISGKRPSESVEVAIAAKRQALESSTGSPKASNPKKTVSLSRESSFKSLDNGKVKPGQQIPIRNHHGGDDIALARSLSTGPRSQAARSTLLKSNSFNNFNSKPRAKLIDEVVPQKQKGGGQYISKNMDTPAGLMSKSMSFKSSNLGRATDSKVKMLSSKPGTAQDLKGSRHGKESGVFDRKTLSRIDRPVVSASKGDQKLTPRGETAKPSAVNHNREFKVNQDGKLNSLSKSMNNIGHKSRELQERTSTSGHETQQNGLPRSRDTANQIDKTKDGCSDRVRSSLTNTSECCTIGGTQELGDEVSVNATSSSKEEMHNGNSLKAAIHAALLRRPEIHKKKDVPERTGEFPTSGTDLKCEVSYQDRVSVSNTLKNSISTEETNAKQETLDNSTFETSKCLSANNLKQLHFCPADFRSQPRKSDSVGSASGKPVVKDLLNRALEISNVISKTSAIPEYKYIWQGVFEVHRSGKPPDLYTGIQAHLSSCASPKVLDVVNKFLPEVSLHEVSRLSTWPSQFHQGGGSKEDNIALYFFAKDIESYERYYKSLLDHMIKNDLALKGTFDGVELLIFTSNQLPENSQRWNTLFFLWGIFRGRRINHSDSAKKICIPSLNVIPNEKCFPTAVMTLSETPCSPARVGAESIACCGKAGSALLPSTSIEQAHILVSRNFDTKETIFDQTHLRSQVNIERQDSRINTNSSSKIPKSSTQLCQ